MDRALSIQAARCPPRGSVEEKSLSRLVWRGAHKYINIVVSSCFLHQRQHIGPLKAAVPTADFWHIEWDLQKTCKFCSVIDYLFNCAKVGIHFSIHAVIRCSKAIK